MNAPASPRPTRRRSLLWLLPVTLAALVAGAVIGRIIIERYLQSEAFRNMVCQRTGQTIRGRVECTPLRLTGSAFTVDEIEAKGGPAANFSSARIDQARVEVSTRRFFDGVWMLDHLEAEHVTAALDGPREPELSVQSSGSIGNHGEAPGETSWLPHRLEVSSALVHRAELHWEGGRVDGVTLTAETVDGGWNIRGDGGSLIHGAWPRLDVVSMKLRALKDSLVIQSAELRQGAESTIAVTGEIRFGESLNMDAKLDRVPLDPLLASDWRLNLAGELNGSVHVESKLPAENPPTVSGEVNITNGRLQALPILDQLAAFTGSAQFRQLHLSAVSGKFRQTGSRLEVTQMSAESSGLAKLVGSFTINEGKIDGTFQIGVTPATVQWIPGAKNRVFVTALDGYLWAPLHVHGPVEKPQEDLTARLGTAAAGEVVDTVQKAFDGKLPKAAAPVVEDAARKLINGFGGLLK